MDPVRLALDWTPNTNHAGFYVAKWKGYFRDLGLDVRFISAHEDGYTTLPAERVCKKEATFGIANSETIINYNTRLGPQAAPVVKAVAAILQEDTSAIVTLRDSGIDRPCKLDGKRYATYGARYEGSLVRQLIKSDGGRGAFQELSLPLLGLWNTVVNGHADATWVFMGWEGVEAQRRGIQLNVFRLADYGVPYGYPELIIAHVDTLWEHPDLVKRFLEASTLGHLYAAAHPREAADIIVDLAAEECPGLPDPLERDMVRESMDLVAQYLLNKEGRWGVMDPRRWDCFLDFLAYNDLLTTNMETRRDQGMASFAQLDPAAGGGRSEGNLLREDVLGRHLFTNDFLPRLACRVQHAQQQELQGRQASSSPGKAGAAGGVGRLGLGGGASQGVQAGFASSPLEMGSSGWGCVSGGDVLWGRSGGMVGGGDALREAGLRAGEVDAVRGRGQQRGWGAAEGYHSLPPPFLRHVAEAGSGSLPDAGQLAGLFRLHSYAHQESELPPLPFVLPQVQGLHPQPHQQPPRHITLPQQPQQPTLHNLMRGSPSVLSMPSSTGTTVRSSSLPSVATDARPCPPVTQSSSLQPERDGGSAEGSLVSPRRSLTTPDPLITDLPQDWLQSLLADAPNETAGNEGRGVSEEEEQGRRDGRDQLGEGRPEAAPPLATSSTPTSPLARPPGSPTERLGGGGTPLLQAVQPEQEGKKAREERAG